MPRAEHGAVDRDELGCCSLSAVRGSYLRFELWDLDISDFDRKRPTGYERGQQGKRARRILGLHAPPDCMAADEAGRRRGPAAEGALESEPGGESGCTVAGVVLVLEEKCGHDASMLACRPWVIGGGPLTASLKRGRVVRSAHRPQGWTDRRA
jgi:hypothetical protein